MDFGVKELLFCFRGFNVLPDKCKKICFNDKNSVLNLNSEYWLTACKSKFIHNKKSPL